MYKYASEEPEEETEVVRNEKQTETLTTAVKN